MTRPKASFLVKLVAAAALVTLADRLFSGGFGGAILGVFALAWCLALLLALPRLRRCRRCWIAWLAAAALGGVMIEAPSLLSLALFLVAITLAALMQRRRFDDALSWMQRLLAQVPLGLLAPLLDLRRLVRHAAPGHRGSVMTALAVLALPVLGGALFLALFAGANPLIERALATIQTPTLVEIAGHTLLCLTAFLFVWPTLRPDARVTGLGTVVLPAMLPLGVPLASIALSLVTFNLIFAVQNGLDIAFLWSGAALPPGVTLADYAHRGAYPLIATALLAGLFVLVLLQPGSRAAKSGAVRMLVVVWIAQNVMLVSSSILRTLDYVDAYSLTILRIAALIWMALVGLGLLLICWRMLAGRSAAWLINMNVLAAALVLIAATGIDFGAIVASWNVRHAREVGGRGAAIDLCYLRRLGPSALLPVIELEQRATQPDLKDRAASVREEILGTIIRDQADWHHWSWRTARRLATVQALASHLPKPAPTAQGRGCDGRPLQPLAPAIAKPEPLTGNAQR